MKEVLRVAPHAAAAKGQDPNIKGQRSAEGYSLCSCSSVPRSNTWFEARFDLTTEGQWWARNCSSCSCSLVPSSSTCRCGAPPHMFTFLPCCCGPLSAVEAQPCDAVAAPYAITAPPFADLAPPYAAVPPPYAVVAPHPMLLQPRPLCTHLRIVIL